MDNPKVSIIVPVYNVEKYLSRCMDSLINQTFKEIEIIAVNDGSTDNSLEILHRYVKNDKRIRNINCENMGVSNARNVGVRESRGDFIVFIDSDDWIDNDMIEVMYENIDVENLDLVICTYIREFGDYSKEKILDFPEESIYKEHEVKSELLRRLIGPIGIEISKPENLDALGTVWGKIYKSSVLKDNGIEFIDLKIIGSGEDVLFNINVFNNVKKAKFLNRPMYHYWRNNVGSITSRYIENFIYKRKVYFNYIYEFIKANDLDYEFKIALNNRIAISVLGMGLIECSDGNDVGIFTKIRRIKRILNEKYIVKAYKHLEVKHFPIHWRVFYFLNKHRVALLSFLMINTINLVRKNK